MPRQVIINISCLVNIRRESHILRGKELADLPCINNAYLIIEDGVIAGYGEMKDLKLEIQNPESEIRNSKSGPQNSELKTQNSELAISHLQAETIDANSSTIFPCWCDSHTHLVFAASRE